MKERVMHIIAIIGAAFFSLILIASCIIVPLYYSVTVFTKPETVVKLVQGVNYKTVIIENEYLVEVINEVGVSAEQIDDAIKSDEATEILGSYAEEAMDILMAFPTDENFNGVYLKNLLDNNIDQVLEVAERYVEAPFDKELIKQQVDAIFETKTETIETVIPVLEPVRVVIEKVKDSTILKHTLTTEFVVVVFIVLFLMAVLIALLRYRKLEGLIWLGVDFFVSAALTFAIIILGKNNIVLDFAEKISNFDTAVLEETFNLSLSRLNLGFFILVMLSIACIIAFVVYKVIKHKMHKKQDNICVNVAENDIAQNNTEDLVEDNP